MRFDWFSTKLACAVFLFGSLSVAWLGGTAFGQTSGGSISGVVQDESGAVIPGGAVVVTNVDTGIANSFTTDTSGRYHVPSLIPGHYEVQAQVAGFETGVRKGIQLTVGSSLEINMVLKVGQVAEKTEVTAEAPMVETASSTLAGLVDDKTIRDLPLNGRSFDQLIALQSSSPMFHSQQNGGSAGSQAFYVISGARTQANLYLIDGTEMLGAWSQTLEPGGSLGINMGVEAIQEFAVLASNYSAAYGKKGGGIIQAATRSGTNQFHGSAFEFLRNSALDARDFFDPHSKPAPLKRSNFGGALGGPVRKDHSFFFGNYEGLRLRSSSPSLSTLPDANTHQGLLPDPARPGQFINVGVAPEMKPYLAAYYPLPNGRSFGDGTGEFINIVRERDAQDYYLMRFDQRISDKDSFFARYNFQKAVPIQGEAIGIYTTQNTSRDHVLTMELKRAYVKTVNVFRFGFTRAGVQNSSVVSVDRSLRFTDLALDAGQLSFAQTSGGAITETGDRGGHQRAFHVNQFDLRDELYHYRGGHALQFGVQLQRIQNNDFQQTSTSNGQYVFGSLTGLLTARPTQYQGLAPGAYDPHKSYRRIYFSTFLQDDYKILPNLTLNLGLRYELMTVPVEASGNRIANYHYQFVNGVRRLDSLPTLGSPFWQSNRNTFAPRIGFAWDPFSDGKLAVRGGFGVFYDHMDSDFRFFTASNPPFVNLVNVANPPFPHPLTGGGGTTPLPAPDLIDFVYRVPTRLQFSFGFQRQVTASSGFNINYVGSRSYHLARQLESNSATPQILPGGIYFYAASLPRINPALAQSRLVMFDSQGWYNSLQMDFVQRPVKGVRYKVSYTFARNLDNASRTTTAFAGGEPLGPQNPFDQRPEWGRSGFDLKHSLVANFTYDVPWKTLAGLAGHVLGGWQLSGIVSRQSGLPATIATGFSRSRDLSRNLADRPNLKAGASNNPILGGPDKYFDPAAFELPSLGFYGNVGRNTLTGPGFVSLDFTVVKMTPINDRVKVDFRTEFFNFLNHANFGVPAVAGARVFASNGSVLGNAGRIQRTVTTSRQIQFGMKFIF